MKASFTLALRTGVSQAAQYRAREFDAVPTIAPGLILIYAASGSDAARDAARLENELETVLLASGPAVTVRDAAEADSNSAIEDRSIQKLLVLVVDDTGLADETWFEPWLNPRADRAVLTVFKAGASPPALLPNDTLRAINAQFWKESITESVPAILSLSGVTLEDQRIFISYRRLETQPLAEQLFDALTHEGFDVFLDRFSIRPGLNFQQRLTQELADKSMVLLLESEYIETSTWADHEIQFAKRHKLGLLALTMPDRKEPLASIDFDQRIQLKKTHFEKPDPEETDNPEFATAGKPPPTYAHWGRLTGDKLREVVLTAKAVHDHAVFRRRRFIRTNVEATLRQTGLNPMPVQSDGLMRVNTATANYALWLTTRPPDLMDFRTAHARVQPPPGTKGVVVGPTAALEPGRKDTLDWLKTRCEFACIDQDDLLDAAALMKSGTL